MRYSYEQVTMTILSSRNTEDREYRPLESIGDNYPKYVITRYGLIQQRNGNIYERRQYVLIFGDKRQVAGLIARDDHPVHFGLWRDGFSAREMQAAREDRI